MRRSVRARGHRAVQCVSAGCDSHGPHLHAILTVVPLLRFPIAVDAVMLAAVTELLTGCLRESESMGVFAWVPITVGFIVAIALLVLFDWWYQRKEARAAESSIELRDIPGHVTLEDSPDGRESPGRSGGGEGGIAAAGSGGGASAGDGHPSSASTGAIETGPEEFMNEMRLMGRDGDSGPTKAEIRTARMLVFALAVQHIPEALAMGVAFAAAANPGGSYGAALSLTVAIGLQDIPEGMAAAFVLRKLDMPARQSFFWGQATGWVQPISGVLGALAVLEVQSMLPYALAFAGAAMLFVIVKDMVPDCMSGEDRLGPTVLCMVGFMVMTITSILFDQLEIAD